MRLTYIRDFNVADMSLMQQHFALVKTLIKHACGNNVFWHLSTGHFTLPVSIGTTTLVPETRMCCSDLKRLGWYQDEPPALIAGQPVLFSLTVVHLNSPDVTLPWREGPGGQRSAGKVPTSGLERSFGWTWDCLPVGFDERGVRSVRFRRSRSAGERNNLNIVLFIVTVIAKFRPRRIAVKCLLWLLKQDTESLMYQELNVKRCST